MKKQISKLALKRETLRTLIERELHDARGAVANQVVVVIDDPPNCTGASVAKSGCLVADA